MNDSLLHALTGYVGGCLPEACLGVVACAMFLGGTWRGGRTLWGCFALAGLAVAGSLLVVNPIAHYASTSAARATLYAAPVLFDPFALLIRSIAILGGVFLVLVSWDEVPDAQAADYHACLLTIVAGTGLTGAANELVTLFLALELISIPTYLLLYLPRTDVPAQEAAMKYFLLSIFSSAFVLFGFSYLYGMAGTTNIPALSDALLRERGALPGLALISLVMIVAGLGFRITAVPFHFYAPDVYQGTTVAAAAMLAFIPKVAGFAALIRVLGFVPYALDVVGGKPLLETGGNGLMLGDHVPVLFMILAAVTMSLGNVLALLQDNLRRLLAYSSVAHAGYMLIGLAVAPRLAIDGAAPVGGVEAVLFYLVAYGAMTIGAFAVLAALNNDGAPVETVDDLAGLGTTHPRLALLMAIFLFSLIGMPLTAGFVGKFILFNGAFLVPYTPSDAASIEQYRFYVGLAAIAVVNAAIGGWYYLRIAAAMYLRESLAATPAKIAWPAFTAVVASAVLTLGIGIYPEPLKYLASVAVSRSASSAGTVGPALADGRP